MNIKEQPLEGPSPFLSGGIANAAFRTAMLYRSQKKYVQAISLLKQFLSENPSATLAPTAFIILQQIVSDYARFARTPSLRTVFAAYRDSLLATTVYDRLKRVLLNCKKNDLMQRKAWSQAMGVAEQISNQYPNTPLDLHALFATVTANLFGLGNRQSAAQQYALMQQRFPESDLTAVARLLLDVASSNAAPLSPAANKATLSSSEVAQQPTEFALHQNYPNPFNPSTTIRYDLPVDAPVTLKAYDILGKELMTLVNEDQRAGYHSTVFDASRFASGVYLYQVKAGGFVQTKKLLLLR
jgi:tetratricopeptide (TPR) repeat protein